MTLGDLQDALEALFADPPATAIDCAIAWADAVRGYTDTITPPVAPATQDAAALVLGASLVGFSAPGAAVGVLSAGLTTYAAALAAGMPPASPPAAPPPVPIAATLAPVFAVTYADHATAAAAVAAVIDAWFRTGTSAGLSWV